MTAESDMMRPILENPYDDGPRWVYADWLDEHGEPRVAEFIRLQIAFAANRKHDVSSRLSTLIDVEQVPAKMLGAGPDWWWSGDCESTIITPRSKPSYTFRRGMVDEVRLTLAEFCGGEITAGNRCPKCDRPGSWRSGVHFDHEKICFCGGDRSTVWEPGASFRKPGLAKEIFSKWPATRVVLTDREPLQQIQWWCETSQPISNQSSLTKELFDVLWQLSFKYMKKTPWQSWLEFHSRDDAHTALSQAAVNYGRLLAGLPPIRWAAQTKTAPVAQGR